MTVSVNLPDAEATRAWGARLAAVLRAGDLVVLTGELGAGKTTLAQGIGLALGGTGVRGQIASPTFIIARVHASLGSGPDLVHVDAYRLGSATDLDALDLDTSLDEAVTLVEWGEGLAERLASDRLDITLTRPRGGVDPAAQPVGPDGGHNQEIGPEGGPAVYGPPGGPDQDPGAGVRVALIHKTGSRWDGIDIPQ